MTDPSKIISDMKSANAALAENLTSAGIAAKATDGYVSLANRTSGLFHPRGETVMRTVSASGYVYAGDSVAETRELFKLAETTVCLDGVVVGSCSLGTRSVAVAFVQNGGLYAKVVEWGADNSFSKGNALLIDADAAPETAVVVRLSDSTFAVIYNPDVAVDMAVVKVTNRLAELVAKNTIIESDAVNIAADALNAGRVLISYLAGDTQRVAYMQCVDIKNGVTVPGTPVQLDMSAYGDEGFDDDEYLNAWSVCALDEKTAVVSWFYNHKTPVRFVTVTIDAEGSPRLRHTSRCVYNGSLSRTTMCKVAGNMWLFVNGLARVSESADTKSLVALELWELTHYGAVPIWAYKTAEAFDAGIGVVSVTLSGDGAAVLYSVGDDVVATLCGTGHEAESEQAVVIGSIDRFAKLHGWAGTAIALSVIQREANVYVEAFKHSPRVYTSVTGIVGVAKHGGSSGTEIPIVLFE